MRFLSALLILPWSHAAMAAPVGDPVPVPDGGRVRIDMRMGTGVIQETDARCEGQTGCGADWNSSGIVGGLHIAVVKGLGVYGEVGLTQDQIQAADYKGDSRVWAAGVRVAVPVSRSWWIATNARVDDGAGEGQFAGEDPDPEVATYRFYTGSLLGVWGDASQGGSLWFGGQASWGWDHHVWPLGTEESQVRLDVPLTPDLPASGVLGFGLSSDPVGLPWRTSGRITVAMEGRAGQELGVSGWVGLAF